MLNYSCFSLEFHFSLINTKKVYYQQLLKGWQDKCRSNIYLLLSEIYVIPWK